MGIPVLFGWHARHYLVAKFQHPLRCFNPQDGSAVPGRLMLPKYLGFCDDNFFFLFFNFNNFSIYF